MKDARPQAIKLQDYRPPAFLIDKTDLTFEIFESHTLVTARLTMHRNPNAESDELLQLHGQELELVELQVDDEIISDEQYVVTDEVLQLTSDVLDAVDSEFVVQCKTRIYPQDNTALEGLYKSGGMYCTQCEAEGFRRITYYLDRPDVMSKFSTRIEADKSHYPVLLSNGNLIDSGELDEGRQFVLWEDPFKKPAYLFALVAGDLVKVEDSFTTMSGREVALQIFVEMQNRDKCDHAMSSLKRSMKWDEDVYGREYDLDIFMIVAVDAFNMGAMENKGLNIFNSSCVLAKPQTSTDMDFDRIEAIVAHEYFHNWSGNRVTCRDWFQLSLKEGFTVFRDSQFSADMGSEVVKRIQDVNVLRTVQFAEDAGPMAHPVRPESYIEISNFYTVTIYEKGAEVVRMLHTLLGAERFRKGSDLYFDRHDGQAVTIEEFAQAMQDASDVDLTLFKRWYSQAGTPQVTMIADYDEDNKRYTLMMQQECPSSPGQTEKQAFHIPVKLGLLDRQGNDITLETQDEGFDTVTQVFSFTDSEQSITFENIDELPVPSLFREFSAPVKVDFDYTSDDLLFLLQNDSDGFNRWNACQTLAVDCLKVMMQQYRADETMVLDPAFIKGIKTLLLDEELDPAVVAQMCSLPTVGYLSELNEQIDIEAIIAARQFARQCLAKELESVFVLVYDYFAPDSDYRFEKFEVAKRSLRNLCLDYLMLLEKSEYAELALDQYDEADNMTDQISALRVLVHSESEHKANVIQRFYMRWQNDPLVVNQWLAVQAQSPKDDALKLVKTLMEHDAFDVKNPNKVRSLVGTFCNQNHEAFHRIDGTGYTFLAKQVMALNTINPQIAARLLTPLTRWKRYDEKRQSLMKMALQTIKAEPELSKDVYEVLTKSLEN